MTMSKCEHLELATDAPAKARDFYAKLFSWKVEAMPDGGGGEYLMFRTENGGGGIAPKQMPEQPTAWMPYFTVPSVKASTTNATKMGAAVVAPYMAIGEMGAIAVLRDPTGATFGLWEPGPAAAPAKQAAPAKKATAKAEPKAVSKAAPKAAKKAAKPAKKTRR
jgi:predicted enzyme related to lactoylglutathione lyase